MPRSWGRLIRRRRQRALYGVLETSHIHLGFVCAPTSTAAPSSAAIGAPSPRAPDASVPALSAYRT
jgi:hypothetical protein